jgi:tRNA pseudouridine38-40 synthase
MRNLKLTISYDGTEFQGWQTQPGFRTVQETIQKHIEKITNQKITLYASGRTDTGVHAIAQVANFRVNSNISESKLLLGLNALLPDDISITDVTEVPYDFHAVKDAKKKHYRYVIRQSGIEDPLTRKFSCLVKHELDHVKMHIAAQYLIGTHDFRCFESEWPNRTNSIRTIYHASINRMGNWIWFNIEGNGFLYNMVRAIAGTLIEIGRGNWPVDKISKLIELKERKYAGPTAPAKGLFLVRVFYEELKP